MKKKQLTDIEQDILDGIEIPSLDENIVPDADRGLSEKQLPHDMSVSDSSAESIDSTAIVDAIKQILDTKKEFDPLTNEMSTKDGALSRSNSQPTEDEMNAIIEHTKGRIKSIKDKAAKLKEAIVERQKLSPTIVTFSPKQNALLKKGMVRIFQHKDNTITFDQYRAAMDARHALAERGLEEQTAPLNRILDK